jgi:hypothetical protein
MKFVHGNLYRIYIVEPTSGAGLLCRADRSSKNLKKKQEGTKLFQFLLARHKPCDVYFGARETVGESSVSSGCWGEDSDHEYEWARTLPRSRPFAFLIWMLFFPPIQPY